jgi:hypothetical protein
MSAPLRSTAETLWFAARAVVIAGAGERGLLYGAYRCTYLATGLKNEPLGRRLVYFV